jgi:6-phosphogluconolactonase
VEKLVHSDTETLFAVLANQLFEQLVVLLNAQQRVHIALPGGRSIVGLLQALGPLLERVTAEDKKRLHIYLTDERVMDNYQERNETLVSKYLPSDLIAHFNLAETTAVYNDYFMKVDHRFDVMILGVGEDGHIASIFPGQNSALTTAQYYTAIDHSPKLPAKRISLSRLAIVQAKNIILLFIGPEKQTALTTFLTESSDSTNCPAKIVTQSPANILLVTDNDYWQE